VQPKAPVGSWLWHSLIGSHLVQLLLFVARYFLFVNIWVGRFAAWLVREKTVAVDDSHRIFNVDCRVSVSTTCCVLALIALLASVVSTEYNRMGNTI
jgi:L-gulonolactone oxidase